MDMRVLFNVVCFIVLTLEANYAVAAEWYMRVGQMRFDYPNSHPLVFQAGIAACKNDPSQTPCIIVKRESYGVTWTSIWSREAVPPVPPTTDGDTPNNNNKCPSSSNPIVFSNGQKFLNESDFQSSGNHLLSFSRYFNYVPSSERPAKSYRDLWELGNSNSKIEFPHEDAIYDLPQLNARLSAAFPEGYSIVDRILPRYFPKATLEGKGYHIELTNSGVSSVVDPKANLSLQKTETSYDPAFENSLKPASFVIKKADGSTNLFDIEGRLTQIKMANGETVNYSYSSAFGHTNQTITDNIGRSITLTWIDADHAVMQDTDGRQTHYFFDPESSENPKLKVVYPDNTVDNLSDNPYREYIHISAYDTSGKATVLNGALKEIRDNGRLVLEYAYDEVTGFARHESRPGGVENLDIDYVLNAHGRVTEATTTNALGKDTSYHFQTVNGVQQLSHIEGQTSTHCAASDSYLTYDTKGYSRTETDANGFVIETIRDGNGNITNERNGLTWSAGSGSSLVETTDSQQIDTIWHPDFALPIQRTYRGKNASGQWGDLRREDWVYDTHTHLKTYTETDLTNGTVPYSTNGRARTTILDYTFHDAEQVVIATATVNGPLDPATQADRVDDISTYTYNSQGQLTQVQNAYGHTVKYQAYLNSGKPQTIVDANNLVTRLKYTARGWIDTVTVETSQGNAVTHYEYYPNGLLQKVTLPDNSYLFYEYNDARHLTAVSNNRGERIELTPSVLDGEWTRLEIKDTMGQILRTQERVQDELGRIKKLLTPDLGMDIEFWYDGEGNLESEQHRAGPRAASAKSVGTTFRYDALNRVSETLDAFDKATQLQYDGGDHTSKVIDARLNATTYTHDGFGHLIQQKSPDTGITQFWYDTAGNLTQKKDARGVTVTYRYDALSRITSEQYSSDSTLNVTYLYDQTIVQGESSYGIGPLASALRANADVYYVYDDRGNILANIHEISGITYRTRYQYNAASQLTAMTYPSGRIVNYLRDTVGRIKTITTKDSSSGTATTLLSAVTYQPFGPLTGFKYGNNILHSLIYDTRGRLTDLTDKYGSSSVYQNMHFGYDWASNIEDVIDYKNSIKSQAFSYDDIDRLLNASGSYGAQTFAYDAVGNRTSGKTVTSTSTTTDTLTIASNSNRINTLSRTIDAATPTTKTLRYDGAGNTTSAYGYTATYDAVGRTKTVTKRSITTQFAYNALGERIRKWNTASPSGATHFHYDLAGHLIGETNASGATQRDYVWLGDMPVAIQTGTLGATSRYYVQVNHLNAPTLITSSTRATVWKGDYQPFGTVKTSSVTVANNLRLPGQYFDQETGLHYNYFRDYDPSIGRYLQSDPIGLNGGINTYAYVEGNPVSYIDPFGLQTTIDVGIRQAILRGDVAELRTLLEVANPGQASLIQRALTPARDLIRGATKRSASYASELETSSYSEICKMAKGAGDLAQKAKKMKKLIEQQERLLGKL